MTPEQIEDLRRAAFLANEAWDAIDTQNLSQRAYHHRIDYFRAQASPENIMWLIDELKRGGKV